MMLAKEFVNISNEDQMEDHVYRLFDDELQLDEFVSAPDIYEEEVEGYQIFTE